MAIKNNFTRTSGLLYYLGLAFLITMAGCKESVQKIDDSTVITFYPSEVVQAIVPIDPGKALSDNLYSYGDITGWTLQYKSREKSKINGAFLILDVDRSITDSVMGFVRTVVEQAGAKPSGKSLESVTDRASLQSLLETYEALLDENEHHCEVNFSVFPIFLDDDFVTYTLYGEIYFAGAANADQIQKIVSFNLKTGNALGIDDIVKGESVEELRGLVAAHMASRYFAQPNEPQTMGEYIASVNEWIGDDGTKEAITLENFPINPPALSRGGLIFYYEKYQLTPGSAGCPTVLLSYSEVAPLLRKPFDRFKDDDTLPKLHDNQFDVIMADHEAEHEHEHDGEEYDID